ncbi:hypothetical protein KM043_016293 [Ampulex compressa]|nr:hypothetical protein KM043_016293 [Ampulex compressa]
MFLRTLTCLSLLTVSVFCLTADEIEAERSGWNLSPNTQYHIQTDEGPERYFRFQTLNGQYRKEKRLADGTVVGTEGWLDPLGYLRLKDYIADHEGFRILRSKMVYVGKDRPIQDAVTEAKNVPAQTGVLARPRRPPNPFRKSEIKNITPILGNDISSGYYSSSTAKPRVEAVYAPKSSNDFYYGSKRPSYTASSGLQSFDRYNNPLNSYYGGAPQTPVQTLQAPVASYEPTTRSSSTRRSYRPTPITRESSADYPLYDGTHSTANGFQYFLKRQYHEEEREPSGENIGSFGYIDPFGIRRVIYYKTDPQTGEFIHKKNNRYVGFSGTPYDPSYSDSSRRQSRSPSTIS